MHSTRKDDELSLNYICSNVEPMDIKLVVQLEPLIFQRNSMNTLHSYQKCLINPGLKPNLGSQ